MTTKAVAQQAHKQAQRDIRAFLRSIPNRALTASEEAKRKRLIQAEDQACQACWHADDTPPVRRKVSELRAELEEYKRQQDPEPRPAASFNRREAAIHEAGHAVGDEVRGVRVVSVTLRECMSEKADEVAALCGAAAAIRAGYDDHHSPSDLAVAKQALSNKGHTDRWLPAAEGDARRLVAACWPMIQGVAAALYQRGQLSGDDVRGVMRQAVLALHEREVQHLQHAHAQHTTQRFPW